MVEHKRITAAVACGGTGGHMFPGMALARVLRERGMRVHLLIGRRSVEQRSLLPDCCDEVHTIACRGFGGSALSWQTVRAAGALAAAAARSARLLRAIRCDVVIGMGSYSMVGPATAARWLGVPIVLHEGNAVPGRAVDWCAPRAALAALAFPEAAERLRRARRTAVCGTPVRGEFERLERARPSDGPLRILVAGGSHGAERLNRDVPRALASLERGAIRVAHLAGPEAESVRESYRQAGIDATVESFSGEMAARMAAADLAICRAGASTCAELALAGLPAILVPYPRATRNHQSANARVLEHAGAAERLEEADSDAAALGQLVGALAADRGRLERMAAAMARRAVPHAADRLADLVEGVLSTERCAGGGR
jgi:UDP-N-acetylglucosamine--N-acetylmuramyl-(pentapeptide) pyrophosphoryl-undecaprenol N-acetylglucosamine transferase